jgi:hypothetical protein
MTHYDKKASNSILSVPGIRNHGFKQLNSSDPAFQYQTQKIIQNTVRVPSSLYTMDLAALNVYQFPDTTTRVNWNQMSDRAYPASQKAGAGGSFYHGSSAKRSQTRERPGSLQPGGKGVDIKHNSYARYLNRIKGGKLARRGPIPSTYGDPIPFSCAAPIYGSKTVKTSIVNYYPLQCDTIRNCNLPTDKKTEQENIRANSIQYSLSNSLQHATDIYIHFKIGDKVYARTSIHYEFRIAIVTYIYEINDSYQVQFIDDNSCAVVSPHKKEIIPISSDLSDCGDSQKQNITTINPKYSDDCILLNNKSTPDITLIAKILKQEGLLNYI